jgi:hypothetical protein
MNTVRPPEIPAPPEGWIYFEGPLPSLLQTDTHTDLIRFRRGAWNLGFLNGSSGGHYAVLSGSPTAIRIGLTEVTVQPIAEPNGTNTVESEPEAPEGWRVVQGPLIGPILGIRDIMVWAKSTKEWLGNKTLNGKSTTFYAIRIGSLADIEQKSRQEAMNPTKPKKVQPMTVKQLALHFLNGGDITLVTEPFSAKDGKITGKGLIKSLLKLCEYEKQYIHHHIGKGTSTRFNLTLLQNWMHMCSIKTSGKQHLIEEGLEEFDRQMRAYQASSRLEKTCIVIPKHLGFTWEDVAPYQSETLNYQIV